MHYDNYLATIGKGVKGVRPDLLGLRDDGTWMIFESKGRSGGFDQAAFDKAIAQAKSVTGAPTGSLLIASETYFSPANSPELSVRLEDPEPSSLLDIALSPDAFVHNYYQVILDLLANQDSQHVEVGDWKASLALLPEMDMEVGLLDPVLEALKEPRGIFERLKETLARTQSMGTQTDCLAREESLPVGPDGVVVVLGSSWNSL